VLLPLPAAGAALLAALVYLNALDNPFVYDDFRLIVENRAMADPWDLGGLIVLDITRPIVPLSYAIDTIVWGRAPFGYHVTNLLLHVLNVVLVYWVALLASEDHRRRRQQVPTTSPAPVAFTAAVLFAVHPMMTQAVGYISGRSELAYSAFFLAALLAGRRWMLGRGRRWWAICLACWIASILAKETGLMLPVLLFLYDRLVLPDGAADRRRRLWQIEVPMLAGMAAAASIRLAVLAWVEYEGRIAPDPRFALVATEVFWRYLAMFFVQVQQSIFHPVTPVESLLSPRAWASLLGVMAFAAVAWRLRQVNGLVGFGLLWFALLLVPSSALFVLGLGEPMAEHRVYLSAAGLFLTCGCAFGLLWGRGGRRRSITAAALAVCVASFCARTVARNAVWEDPVMLAREAVMLAPAHWMPRLLVAEALRQNGRCQEAVDEYRSVIRMHPSEEFPYTRLAGCLMEARRFEEAEAALEDLRAVNPESLDASVALGLIAILRGNAGGARVHLERASGDPGRTQVGRMLAFLDRRLPEAEQRRLCDELGALTGEPPADAGCSAPQAEERTDEQAGESAEAPDAPHD
jgi:hypothetical protein